MARSGNRRDSRALAPFEAVPDGVYDWEDIDDSGDPALVVVEPGRFVLDGARPLDRSARSSKDGREASLYFEFAQLAPTPKETIRFANRYGELGLRHRRPPFGIAEPTPEQERFSDWLECMEEMSAALELWDAIGKSDTEQLAQWITHEPRRVQYEHGRVKTGAVLDVAEHDYVAGLIVGCGQDLINEGRVFLAWSINTALREHATTAFIIREGRYAEPELRPSSSSLIGAMWLQLADAVGRGIELRRCAYERCGRLFPETRSGRRYCPGGTCRMSAHRVRKAAERGDR